MSELEELRAQVAALTRQVDAARKLVEVIEDKNRRWVARAESAEARITAAWDLVVEDGRFTSDLARAVRAALREPVGEPQPEPCARCHDSTTRFSYIDHPASLDAGSAIRVDGPCPSCSPKENEK